MGMAAPLLRIDSSSVSHLAVCRGGADGCAGWRGSPVRTRSKAQAQADDHRRTAHPSAASKADYARREAQARDAVDELDLDELALELDEQLLDLEVARLEQAAA